MGPFDLPPLTIRKVERMGVRAALRLLFAGYPQTVREQHIDRLLPIFRDAGGELDGLFEARRGEAVLGVVWAQLLGNRTAEVLAPVPREDRGVMALLLAEANQFLHRSGIHLAQACIGFADLDIVSCFLDAGYNEVTNLLSLACDLATPRSDLAETSLRVIPYSHDFGSERLERLVRETFVNSSDIPELDAWFAENYAVRRPEPVAAGQGLTWFLAFEQGQAVGCLSVKDLGRDVGCEIGYMGLIETARGRGRGADLVRAAKRATRLQQRDVLLTTVDERNQAAVTIYRQNDFEIVDRRRLLLQFFSTPGGSAAF